MATDKYLKELLLRYRTIVVVGFSKNDNKIANRIPMALKAIGYNVVPVNPTMEIYEGMNVFGSLSDVKKLEYLWS